MSNLNTHLKCCQQITYSHYTYFFKNDFKSSIYLLLIAPSET